MSSTVPSFTVTGLTRNAEYTVAVAAVNSAGRGPWATSWTKLPDVPNVPTIASTSVTGSTITVTITPPNPVGSYPLTGYNVEVTDGTNVVATSSSATTSMTVTGLSRGATYTVVAAATSFIGQSAWSTPKTVTLWDVPGVPSGPPQLSLTETGIKVDVFNPWNTGGTPITANLVEVRDGANVVARDSSLNSSFTLTGLERGKTYTVVTAAANAVGQGPWTTPVNVRFDTPDAPVVTSVAPLVTGLQFTIRPPDTSTGSTPDRYAV